MFAGLLPLLAFGPYAFEVPPDVASASAYEGYSARAAYALAAAWLTLSAAAASVLALARSDVHNYSGRPATDQWDPVSGVPLRTILEDREFWLSAGIVFALVVVVYFPPFLAESGALLEANVHLTALHRMLGGQRPYTDFEFLYGPLMLFPARVWMRVFGYSLFSFYAYVAMLEASQYALVVAILWWLVPDRRSRWFALLVLGALMFNVLIGPNWSATRRLPGLIGIVSVAVAPFRVRIILAAAALFGIQLAYSHDIGVACVVAAGVMYAVLFFTGERRRAVLAGAAIALGSVVVWFALALALLGRGFGAYVSEAASLAGRFSAGEAGFRFYWTVNSVALFGALVFTAVTLGTGSVRNRGIRPVRADLLLIGGFVFALVALKSGLNRADLWHLDATIFPLAMALLIPGRRRFAFSARGGMLARALLGVVAATYAFGLLPSLSFDGASWVHGAARAFGASRPHPAAAAPPTPAPVLGLPLRDSSSSEYKLASLLARPEWFRRPIVFYSDTWALPKEIGRYKTDPLNDDFLYSDERGLRFRRFLEARPNALVLINRRVFDRLFGLADPNVFPEYLEHFKPTAAKRIASWLSTTHYHGLEIEARLNDERWRRTVGETLRSRYHAVAEVGGVVVLAPLPSAK